MTIRPIQHGRHGKDGVLNSLVHSDIDEVVPWGHSRGGAGVLLRIGMQDRGGCRKVFSRGNVTQAANHPNETRHDGDAARKNGRRRRVPLSRNTKVAMQASR